MTVSWGSAAGAPGTKGHTTSKPTHQVQQPQPGPEDQGHEGHTARAPSAAAAADPTRENQPHQDPAPGPLGSPTRYVPARPPPKTRHAPPEPAQQRPPRQTQNPKPTAHKAKHNNIPKNTHKNTPTTTPHAGPTQLQHKDIPHAGHARPKTDCRRASPKGARGTPLQLPQGHTAPKKRSPQQISASAARGRTPPGTTGGTKTSPAPGTYRPSPAAITIRAHTPGNPYRARHPQHPPEPAREPRAPTQHQTPSHITPSAPKRPTRRLPKAAHLEAGQLYAAALASTPHNRQGNTRQRPVSRATAPRKTHTPNCSARTYRLWDPRPPPPGRAHQETPTAPPDDR